LNDHQENSRQNFSFIFPSLFEGHGQNLLIILLLVLITQPINILSEFIRAFKNHHYFIRNFPFVTS